MDLRPQQRYQAQQRYDTPQQAQPVMHQTPPAQSVAPQPNLGGTASRFSVDSLKKYAVYGVAALLILVIAWYLWSSNANSMMSTVKKDHYQAVFLTNGQVYFGKIKGANDSTVTMGDIYYLQQDVQGSQEIKSESTQDKNQMSLTKLGNEIHGPENAMYIQRDQVLFWENLKSDSEVVKSINNAAKQN